MRAEQELELACAMHFSACKLPLQGSSSLAAVEISNHQTETHQTALFHTLLLLHQSLHSNL